jgi:hypothetical protein
LTVGGWITFPASSTFKTAVGFKEYNKNQAMIKTIKNVKSKDHNPDELLQGLAQGSTHTGSQFKGGQTGTGAH